MARVWQFQWPTNIHFGRGAMKGLGEVVRPLGTSAMLVGYRDRAVLGEAYDRAVAALERTGIAVTTFFRVLPEPGEETVLEGARLAVENQVRVILGLGGGSVLDAAKGIAAVARVDGALWDYAMANPQAREIGEALPIVAIPTTAGTGSEVTPVAVFGLTGVGPNPHAAIKATLSSANLYPRAALIDPDLALGCPPELVATAGADALGHALEAYLSRRANPMSSLLAAQAVGLIYRNLRQAVARPDDPNPREPLALAAMSGGAAFTGAGVTVGHAIAHALGGVLHVPHSRAVAMAIGVNLRFNAEACRNAYAELAAACGIGGASPADQAARFVEEIHSLLTSVGLPDRLAVPADAPVDLIDRLVANAQQSTAIGLTLNPRKVTPEALAALFHEVLDRGGKAG